MASSAPAAAAPRLAALRTSSAAMLNDGELLDAWRAGDRAAGAALFERHHAAVARFLVTRRGQARDRS